MSAIVIEMTSDDAERLTVTSMAWGNQWASQDGRFELLKNQNEAPSYHWGHIHWMESGAAAYILFTSYLTAHGFGHELLWDLAEDGGYVVLTDWIGETP
jgi:hypothetical protein